MARVIPDGWRELDATGAAARKLQTLAQLAAGLNDDYTVYHGVHWTRVERSDYAICGEIDFAIVGPTGKLLLIEEKSGILFETARGLVKKLAGRQREVAIELARSAEALFARLRQVCKDEQLELDILLYCPDHTVKEPGSAGIDPERIVDATRKHRLLDVVRSIVPASGDVLSSKAKIHRFLSDTLELVPEVHAVVGEAAFLYTRLSGGLAHWARRLEFEPFRLRVIGTAGSGKTQLAMAVYRDAVAQGRRPLYVCYNRPLADHIAMIAPEGGEIATYHQLADRVARAQGKVPDFRQPDAAGQYDELIVDEGQDFKPSWAANVMRFVRAGARAWWLEDPMQNLYGRPPLPLDGWVTLRSDVNYRSPKEVAALLNRVLPQANALEAGSPLAGPEVDILTYSDSRDLVAKTVSAVTRCIGLGFKRSHVAIVTYRGREHSQLSSCERLGPYPLRAPTGQYDLLGNAIFTEGDVPIDSVLRFKGRASPCVVFTEIDFDTLDDVAARRLFVGATRATLKLVLVASERTAALLGERLGAQA